MRSHYLRLVPVVILAITWRSGLEAAEALGAATSAATGDEGDAARPKYDKLSEHYSKDVHECPDISTSPNQCAVRVSRALVGAGIKMDSEYPGKLCRHGYARGAQDLGAFLKKKVGTA